MPIATTYRRHYPARMQMNLRDNDRSGFGLSLVSNQDTHDLNPKYDFLVPGGPCISTNSPESAATKASHWPRSSEVSCSSLRGMSWFSRLGFNFKVLEEALRIGFSSNKKTSVGSVRRRRSPKLWDGKHIRYGQVGNNPRSERDAASLLHLLQILQCGNERIRQDTGKL